MTRKPITMEEAGTVRASLDDLSARAEREREKERQRIEAIRNRPEIVALREQAAANPRPLSTAEQWTAPLPRRGEVSAEREAAEAAAAAEQLEQERERLWHRCRQRGVTLEIFNQHIWPGHLRGLLERQDTEHAEAQRDMAETIRNWW